MGSGTKQANEKLASKIREQSRAIIALTAEKDHLQDQLERYQRNYENSQADLEDKKLEIAKYKELQAHSAQQQVMLEQMRVRLEDHESEQAEELHEKGNVINDLHARLKSNVTTIQQLNNQLNNMNKDNLKMKSALDKELSERNMLQYQLETKSSTINELRSQLDSLKLKQLYPSAHDSGSKSSRRVDKNLVGRELEKAGVADPNDLDKSYWISRVGELSVQLQQSTDYWKNKLREVQVNAEQDRYRSQYDMK
jgi:chromosome segregation ATPase